VNISEGTLWTVSSIVGGLSASALACVPGLHVSSIAVLALWVASRSSNPAPPALVTGLLVGLTAGYAMSNGIAGILMAAPDESTLFILRPGQRLLRSGRGYEAVMLTGAGGLGGLLVLMFLVPVFESSAEPFYSIIAPHVPWILWAGIAYLLLSEWPTGLSRSGAGLRRLFESSENVIAGLLTFLLAGSVGIILSRIPPLPSGGLGQSALHPAFCGFFAVPSLLQSVATRAPLPRQQPTQLKAPTAALVAKGTLTGTMGGLFAAVLPVITAGIGSIVAGHATAERDDRVFLISQGTCKFVYYVGGLLLFFVPGLNLTRGSVAWLASGNLAPSRPEELFTAAGAALCAGAVSYLALPLLARGTLRLVAGLGYARIGSAGLVIVVTIVFMSTGWFGLIICAVSAGIGLIPVYWGCRRVNCLAVVLLPTALDMIGAGPIVVRLFGLR
jgi:putative membrane protein